jgi:hypothetical protein
MKNITLLAVVLMAFGISITRAGNQYDSQACPDPGTTSGSCQADIDAPVYRWSNQCYNNNLLAYGASDPTGFFSMGSINCNLVQPPTDSPCYPGVYNCGGSPYEADPSTPAE